MSKIETNPPQEKSETTDGALKDAIEMQINDASRRLFKQNPIQETTMADKQPEVSNEDTYQSAKPNFKKRQIIAGGVGLALVAGSGSAIAVANVAAQPPTFSEKTTEYTVQPGDGLYDVVESIPGINSVDEREAINHVSVDPANIDVLKDGLQPGEQIEVPVSINGASSSEK